MRIKVSDHAKIRCEQSNIGVGRLIKEVASIPNIVGKISWKTKFGVIIVERVNEGLLLIKTFIARFKYRGKQYHKGCRTI